MTTVLTLRHALLIVLTLAAYGVAAMIGAPNWLAALMAGLACGAALGLPRLLRRFRPPRDGAAPPPDPGVFGAALAARIRLFAGDLELGDRGVYCVVGCLGVDVAAMLTAAEFSREVLVFPGGPEWSLWRRGGVLCIEVPATYLDEGTDGPWQSVLDVLPRRLLRSWTRGAILMAPWDRLEAGAPTVLARSTELARDRLRAWSRRLGLALPVHVVVAGAGEPALAPLLAPPLKASRDRPWGFRLPHLGDPATCEQVAAAELEALTAAFANRVVEGLGDPETRHLDVPGGCAQPRHLLPLIDRLRRLTGPVSRLVAALLAGGTQTRTIWPRGVYLASVAPAAFGAGFFADILPADAGLVRPTGSAQIRRHRTLCAAGLALSIGVALLGVFGLSTYRANQALLTSVREVAADFPVAAGPSALPALERVRALSDKVADFTPWPGFLAGLATATRLRSPLGVRYSDSVHKAIYLPTMDRARALLCPAAAAPLTDDEIPAFTAALELYVLGTRVMLGDKSIRTAAESEVEADRQRLATILAAGVESAWSRDARLSPTTREQIAGLLQLHLPRVLQNMRIHPLREESCVRQAQQRLQEWRKDSCSAERLAELVPGRHSLRELLQSKHVDALAKPDDQSINAVYTASGFADLRQRFADPVPRCGPGGFVFGHLQAADRRFAEARRQALFATYAREYIAAWEGLLGSLAPATPERGCADLPNLMRRLAAADGPLRMLPDLVARVAVPAVADKPADDWHHPAGAAIGAALRPYTEASQARAEGEKPVIEGALTGVNKLRDLLKPDASQSPAEADLIFAEAKTHVDNACSLLDARGAGFLRQLVQPVFDQTFRCVQKDPPGVDPWCAEVAGPFARGLGGAYPFARNARREVQLADLCTFYCPQKGAAWTYWAKRLASVLFAVGDGRFTPNDGPGFVSFRGYNPALASFYARTSKLSGLLFPFGDAPQPSLALMVYVPPIDQPGVEVEQVSLELDGKQVAFTNARERWRDLQWPGEAGGRSQAAARLRVTGRYQNEPFSEELQEHGVWALFRLLERASEASWIEDHLRFRFTFAALHGLEVDLELDAGLANELLLGRDGAAMTAFRSPQVTPPLQLRRTGAACPF